MNCSPLTYAELSPPPPGATDVDVEETLPGAGAPPEEAGAELPEELNSPKIAQPDAEVALPDLPEEFQHSSSDEGDEE